MVSKPIFFFKQKTAYEITVRDWSSDVCSSDLRHRSPIFAATGYLPLLPSLTVDKLTRSEERRVGKDVDCCVDLGGRRIIKKKKKKIKKNIKESLYNKIKNIKK